MQPSTFAVGDVFTETKANATLTVKDTYTIRPYLPYTGCFLWLLLGFICGAYVGGWAPSCLLDDAQAVVGLFTYTYLTCWVVYKSVRKNTGLPPPFFSSDREYRGW